jgi:hypothetical protein
VSLAEEPDIMDVDGDSMATEEQPSPAPADATMDGPPTLNEDVAGAAVGGALSDLYDGLAPPSSFFPNTPSKLADDDRNMRMCDSRRGCRMHRA